MLNFLIRFTPIFVPVFVASVSVNIDGVIDLGPNWNYEYRIKTTKDSHADVIKGYTIAPESFRGNKHNKRAKDTTKEDFRITKFGIVDPKNIYGDPRTVSEDNEINDFTYHVYKQALKVFNEIKKKVDPAMEHKVELLALNYDEKFREFINETLNHKIKTRLGSQRVVLNVMDTSNRLLKRLVNYFIGEINKEGFLSNSVDAANVFQKEINRNCELEKIHACSKFGICRTSGGLSEFLIDFLTIIIKNNNTKIKQAADGLTEVMKNTDFSKVMDTKTKKKFRHKIEMVEKFDADMLKALFWITKNVFALKNQPINVMVTGSKHINKTVAFLEIVNEMDRLIPSNDENKLEWTDIKTSLTDWSRGKRHDILEVMQGLVTFLKKKGIDKLDSATARHFNHQFEVIFS